MSPAVVPPNLGRVVRGFDDVLPAIDAEVPL
jgi:hypothetical protein